MQEAIVARQILQQQAANRRDVTVASDAIRGDMSHATLGYSTELENVPFEEVTFVGPDTSDLHLTGWSFLSVNYTFGLPVPSPMVLDITESDETFSTTVTSDQIEDGGAALLRNERGEIYARLEDAKLGLGPASYTRIKRRLDFLFEPDDGQDVRISPGSMRQFLQFMQKNRKLRFPAIVITDKKNIKAIWRVSGNEIFWIEFEPNGDVTYLAFFPNDKRSDGIERTSALSTAEDVSARAKTIGALRWMRS